MKRLLACAAPLFLSFPAFADYANCDQYVDVHESERADFDSRYRNYDKQVLEPLRRQIADLDANLGDAADLEKRAQKLEKQNRGFEGDNRGASSKNAKAESGIQNNERLIAEKRRQVEAADSNGDSKRANKLRDEISKLTKKSGKLQAAIAQREVKVADRNRKIAANRAEIAQIESRLNRANADGLLKQRRAIDEQLEQQTETYERARRVVDVTRSAIDLCEAYADLQEDRP